MAGLNFMHAVAQAWEAGKLFHIDLNDQMPGRYDQDLRFGSANLKPAFWLVKFLEGVGYDGPRHFDAHAYRTEDYEGVKDFIWLEGDHYKWRAMRANGIAERLCTGDAPPYERFCAWARTAPPTLRELQSDEISSRAANDHFRVGDLHRAGPFLPTVITTA